MFQQQITDHHHSYEKQLQVITQHLQNFTSLNSTRGKSPIVEVVGNEVNHIPLPNLYSPSSATILVTRPLLTTQLTYQHSLPAP